MKLSITPSARADFWDIKKYIEEDNPMAAIFIEEGILKVIDHLLLFPTMGRVGRTANTRELVINNTPYIVKYQLRQDRIIILRVLHAARKWL